jgi:hypothetical protein
LPAAGAFFGRPAIFLGLNNVSVVTAVHLCSLPTVFVLNLDVEKVIVNAGCVAYRLY